MLFNDDHMTDGEDITVAFDRCHCARLVVDLRPVHGRPERGSPEHGAQERGYGAGVTAGLAQAAIASPISTCEPAQQDVGMRGGYLMGLAACS